jgi:hypothetical protein
MPLTGRIIYCGFINVTPYFLMTYRISLLFLLLSFVLFTGCGGVKKPEGFPNLVRPVTIKIHKNGEPLSDVSVILHPKDSMMPFNISGRTGADGVTVLQTSRNTYIKAGAPVGKFLVQLTEEIDVDMSDFKSGSQKKVLGGGVEIEIPKNTAASLNARVKEFNRRADALRRFPKVLTSTDKSPLEIEITSSTTVEFDVSKY